MSTPARDGSPAREHRLPFRVRYCETDAMGVVHHANHLIYFEMGRTEFLRELGGSYRSIEDDGLRLVVVKAEVKYHKPAFYDDELVLITRLAGVTPAKMTHTYELTRDGEVLASGTTTLACLDATGAVRRMTDAFDPGELSPPA
ncbi:MAG: thioesterase family protein [Planctomycetota bacterium]